MSEKVVSETSLMILQHSCLIISQPHLAELGPKIAVTCLPRYSDLAFVHLGTGGWWSRIVKSQLVGLFSVPRFSADRECIIRTAKLPLDVGSYISKREKVLRWEKCRAWQIPVLFLGVGELPGGLDLAVLSMLSSSSLFLLILGVSFLGQNSC